MKNHFRNVLALLAALVLAVLMPLSVFAEAAEEVPAEAETATEAPLEADAASEEPEEAERASEAPAETEAPKETEEAAETEAASGEPVLLGSRAARIFPGTLDSTCTLTTWDVEGETDVPYVPLRELLSYLFEDEAGRSSVTFSWEGNTYVITQNGESIYADLDAQTVRCGNWRAFRGPHAPGALPAGIVEANEFIAIRPSVKNESTQTEPLGYEVRMADYALRMIRHGDDVLMPFAAAQNVFAAPFGIGVLGYNGQDYFDLANCYENIYGTETMSAAPNPYADRWFSGPFASRKEISEAFAAYNYNTMCLLLDLTFGHKEEKGITRMDTYLEEQGLKEAFMTTDPADDADSLKKLFNALFDSGHDAQVLSRSIFDSEAIPGRAAEVHKLLDLIGYDSVSQLQEDLEPLLSLAMKLMSALGFDPEEERKDMEEKAESGEAEASGEKTEMGPNTSALVANSLKMMILKPLLYGKNRVDIEGDTCVIYFESFQVDLARAESYYTKIPTRADMELSTFALLHYAFEEIKKNGNVKKVVFDLSNNGGGSAAALVAALGFLSEDGEVHITYRDLLNRNFVSEYYHVDTNLDGEFDDQDGYGGQYDFYILTSPSSYSCGNALPFFAQVNRQAKVIGTKPGGGDCVVCFYVDATGHIGANSGFLQLGIMDGDTFVSDETAVEMDRLFSEEEEKSVYFHPDRIAELIAGMEAE